MGKGPPLRKRLVRGRKPPIRILISVSSEKLEKIRRKRKKREE